MRVVPPLVLAVGLLIPVTARAGDPPGKAIFLASKCNKCHVITLEKVERLPKDASEEDADAALPPGEKKREPPDLSGVGNRHETAWMKDFLQKKIEKDGQKHLRKFKGTDAELDQLVSFLSGLEQDPPR